MNYQGFDDSDRPQPTIEDVIEHLRKGENVSTSDTLLYGLSDLSDEALLALRPVWQGLDTGYKQLLVEILIDEMQDDLYGMNYDELGVLCLTDAQASVRRAGAELLAISDSLAVLEHLVRAIQVERVDMVKAELATTLGAFVYLDEVGDIAEGATAEARELLLRLYLDEGEGSEVRGRALEAIAYSSEVDVDAYIMACYRGSDDVLKRSAVVAMGRTADTARWENIVIDEIERGTGDVQLEAVRAAGELQIEEAVPVLMAFFEDSDTPGQEVVVWSLGEIGSREAVRFLERIAEIAEEEDDEEMLMLVEDALSQANLFGGMLRR
jgi:HEAT repeat protein